MKPINFGKTDEGKAVSLDLEQAEIRFILLAGMTGSGKSVFHTHLYREFMKQCTPSEVGFVFLDMTRLDFMDWDARYLIRPTITDPAEALRALETLKDEQRTIIVHIEECDMVYHDRARLEKAIERILHENKKIYIVYSTSRIDPDYLTDWIEKYVDLKVIFRVAAAEDSMLLLGSGAALSLTFPGERILAFDGKVIKCAPL